LPFKERAFEGLNWYEWLAIQAQLEASFHRRKLTVEDMRKRLYADLAYQQWAEDNDPTMQARNDEILAEIHAEFDARLQAP
jgi:hypothetical protein